MSAVTYFWRRGKLECMERRILTTDFEQSSMLSYLYCPCVLRRDGFALNHYWCGYFTQTEKYRVDWSSAPIDQMPKEFRLALLLLGVS